MDFQYPCIKLFPSDWDDYSYRTQFTVTYCLSAIKPIAIGETKIIHKELEPDGYHVVYTKDFLPDSFEYLDENYVSLFQEKKCYEIIKGLFPDKVIEVLTALRDAGYDRNFLSGYKHPAINTSLLRSLQASEALNEGRVIISAESFSEAFHFDYIFHPKYNEEQDVEVPFNFDKKDKYFPNRIICLIGQNGCGKTQLLESLPSFLQKNTQIPFNRIIHITNSFFDRGIKKEIMTDVLPEYKYFGLVNVIDNKVKIQTKEEQITEITDVLNTIIERFKDNSDDSRLIRETFINIKNLFPRVNFDEIIFRLESYGTLYTEKISFPRFIKDFSIMSSGESILLSNLIKILSAIVTHTLILIDEPEIHLHPNFITNFMEFIYKLLDRFDSYALIATHSTYIIREIKFNCVTIIDRNNENQCLIYPATRQTLGTNAMSLSTDIFQNDLIQPYFKTQINFLIHDIFDSKCFMMTDQEQIFRIIQNEIFKTLEVDSNHLLDIGIKMDIHKNIKDLINVKLNQTNI